MKIYYSELCLMNKDLTENIKKLMEYGAEYIELMLDGKSWDGFEGRMDDLCNELKKYPVEYAVHSPVWNFNLAASSVYIREASMKAYKDAIIFAYKINAHHVVLHPGFVDIPHQEKEYAKELALKALKELADFNESYKVDLLLENVGNDTTSLYTMEEYMELLNDFPEHMKYIIDIGHANITKWSIPSLIKTLGSRIKAFHINDNDGEKDIHLTMGEGTVRWDEFIECIRNENRAYDLILEYNVNTDLNKLQKSREILLKELNIKK